MKHTLLYTLLCALLTLTGQADETAMTTKIYPLVFGEPTAMEAAARAIVGDDGHVVLDSKTPRLIVVTTPSRHAQLNEMLGEADVITGNVRMEIRFLEQRLDRESRAALQGDGTIVFGSGRPQTAFQIRPDLRHTVTEQTMDTRQIVLVASGREGVLRVGESVPYVDWIMDYGWHHGYFESRTQWLEVGSFLTVTPTILADGETLHIRLTPELRGYASNGRPATVRFAELATEIIARNGETFQLGGHVDNQEFYSRFLIGVDRSNVQATLDIECTPRIMMNPTRGGNTP